MIRRILKQGAAVIAFNYISLIGNFLFATLLLRFGQDTAFGHYVYLTSLQNTVAVMLGCGWHIGLVRSKSNGESFNASATLYGAGILIVLTITWGAAILTQGHRPENFLSGAVATATTFQILLQPIWQWHGKLATFWAWNVLLALVRMTPVLLLFWWPMNSSTLWKLIAMATWAITLSMVLTSGWIKWNWPEAKKELIFHSSKVLWLSQVAVAFYNRAGLLLLPVFGYFAKDIASFGYIFNVLAAVLLLPALFQNVLMRPLFHREMHGRDIIVHALHWYLLAGVIIGSVFGHGLDQIIIRLTGQTHEVWRDLLYNFSPTIPLVFVASSLGLCLLGEGHDKWRTIGQLISSALFIIALFVLVPRFGLKGAAQATTLSYAILYISYSVALSRVTNWKIPYLNLRLSIFFLLSFLPWVAKWPLG